MPSCLVLSAGVVVAVGVALAYGVMANGDMLAGQSSDHVLSGWQLQLVVTGFCFSGVPEYLQKAESDKIGGDFDFNEDGDISEDDYTKASLYSLLYALYADLGTLVSENDVPYEFTFNTWGFAPSPFHENDPQRHGKAAYSGLVTLPAVATYLEEVTDSPRIVEIGCGTGAGANLITRQILRKSEYTAIDMQAAAIKRCKKIHGSDDNPAMTCVHAPGGIGNDGNQVKDKDGKVMADNSVDFVIISETHIADQVIGPEEKAIFEELLRILKPKGLFLWGNALPTAVFLDAVDYLEGELHMTTLHANNHTAGAVIAREEDKDRVDKMVVDVFAQFPVFGYGGAKGKTCTTVVDRLLKNFYRHPGTALYLKMVNGHDSYMHYAFQKP